MFSHLMNLPRRLLHRARRRHAERRAAAVMLGLGERLLRDIGTTQAEVAQRVR